jgi:hypothetical protein
MKMNRKPQEKFVTLYDTAKKCLLILDYLYSDFENITRSAVDEASPENNSTISIKLYISALGLIDYFHRFHEIVSAMPLIRKDLPEVKNLRKKLAPVRKCRNYLQHMRKDLMINDPITYPILGAISWVSNGKNYVLFSSQTTQNIQIPGISYDRLLEKYTCEYLLIVGGHEIQIDAIYTAVKSFWTWLDKMSVIEPSQIKDYSWGEPTIIHSEIKNIS